MKTTSVLFTRLALPLLLSVLAMVSLRAHAAPVPVEPDAKNFKIGQLDAYSLRDALNVMPNDGKVFGIEAKPADVAEVLKKANAPTDTITLSVDALLVKDGDRLVLLDTGLGPKVKGALMASLAKTGVKPEQITDVLITHSHGDHVGGLVTADGKPAFPKAKVRMAKAEWAFLQSQASMADLVKAITPQVEAFEPGASVTPSISSANFAGHTPGHTGYQIKSGDARLLDIGDSAHSSIISLAKPEWAIGYDTDKAQGKASRQKVLAELAKSHERIFSPHFPYPGVGTIKAEGTGYAWVPELK